MATYILEFELIKHHKIFMKKKLNSKYFYFMRIKNNNNGLVKFLDLWCLKNLQCLQCSE